MNFDGKKNENGFTILERRIDEPKAKKPKKKKTDGQQFKKGSWKRNTYLELKRLPIPMNVEHFHDGTRCNLLVSKITSTRSHVSLGECFGFGDVTGLSKGSPGYDVYVNAKNGLYLRLPWKVYKKLIKINRIHILSYLECYITGDRNPTILDRVEWDITSINDLAEFLNVNGSGVDTRVKNAINCFRRFDSYKQRVHIMVIKSNGKVRTWNDLNKFLEFYGLV